MSIVNTDNCEQLHSLADYFDCAPLKVTAWRLLQETRPGYSSAPAELLETMNALVANRRGASAKYGHGLTGPGENPDPLGEDGGEGDEDSDGGEEGDIFSIFTSTSPGANAQEGLLSSSLRKYSHYVRPDQLPRGTPAAEVVRAWAFRLQEVYNECCEGGADMSAYARDRRGPQGSRGPEGHSEDGVDYDNDQGGEEGRARLTTRTSSVDSANMERMPAVHRMTSKSSLMSSHRQEHLDHPQSSSSLARGGGGGVHRQTSLESFQSDLTTDSSPHRPPGGHAISQPRSSASQPLLQSHLARSRSRERDRESSQRLPVFEEKDDDTSASPLEVLYLCFLCVLPCVLGWCVYACSWLSWGRCDGKRSWRGSTVPVACRRS